MHEHHSRFVIAFCSGIFLGGFLERGFASVKADVGPKHGSILQLEDIAFRKTSHIDEEARPIVKQQLLEPFVAVGDFCLACFVACFL